MLRRVVANFRRQDWTAVVVALLRLRIADIDKDLGNMTVNFDPYIRGPLRHLAKEKP